MNFPLSFLLFTSLILCGVKGALDLPRVGFGTAGLGSRTSDAVCDALREGYRLIDTAQAREWYLEDAVGDALRRCPTSHPVTVVTKIHPRSFEYCLSY